MRDLRDRIVQPVTEHRRARSVADQDRTHASKHATRGFAILENHPVLVAARTPPVDPRMQTPEYWREVWSVDSR